MQFPVISHKHKYATGAATSYWNKKKTHYASLFPVYMGEETKQRWAISSILIKIHKLGVTLFFFIETYTKGLLNVIVMWIFIHLLSLIVFYKMYEIYRLRNLSFIKTLFLLKKSFVLIKVTFIALYTLFIYMIF